MNIDFPVITIDGPSGSGKGTLSRILSSIFKWNLLDSGTIYRVLAWKAILNQVSINNEDALVKLANTINIIFILRRNQLFIFSHGVKINNIIYTEKIGNFASKISMLPRVRCVLLKYQRTFCVKPGLVADGRDMGTIVFPNAILKIFLFASSYIRKQRRLYQLHKNGFNVRLKSISSQIMERDERDYNRNISPLTPAIGSLILDSTRLSIEDLKNKVFIHIQNNLILRSKLSFSSIMHSQG